MGKVSSSSTSVVRVVYRKRLVGVSSAGGREIERLTKMDKESHGNVVGFAIPNLDFDGIANCLGPVQVTSRYNLLVFTVSLVS